MTHENLKIREVVLQSDIRNLEHQLYEVEDKTELSDLRSRISTLQYELGQVRLQLINFNR